MPRGPGLDQGAPLQRLVGMLTELAQEAPRWVNRDRLMGQLEYGGTVESQRDAMARDLRHLRKLGWGIETADQGTDMRLRLRDQDPRLRTLLTDGQQHQLARALYLSGRNPSDLGFPEPTSLSPPVKLLQKPPPGLELEEILHALQHRCLLTFTYKGSAREVHLDDVRRTGTGRWLIVGREAPADGAEQKSYRVDRIEDLRVGLPNSATPRMPLTKDPNPLSIVDGEPIVAVVATEPGHEARVIRDLGVPAERTQVDGQVQLTIPVTNRWLWRMRLYQLGTRVRLIGPEELRDEIRDELLGFTGGTR